MRYLFIGVCLLLSGCVVPVATTGQISTPVPVAVPVFINDTVQHYPNTIYVCKLKPFAKEFRSEHSSRGIAKLNVQKQCLTHHQAMFCEEREIICQAYE